jgi:chromosome segregation ATPase
MSDAAVIQTDLDRLADRIEKAAGIIQQLRAERDRFQKEAKEVEELRARLRGTEENLKGQNPADLLAELQALRKEQRELLAERREVAGRIEALVKKLDRLET